MATKEPRGRLFQDSEFVFTEFDGLKVEQIIICEDSTEEPVLVFLKVENRNWHQYFLDAGIGFWENWDTLNDTKDDDEFSYIDSTDILELRGKIISKIHCRPDLVNSKITIEFDGKEELILRCVNPEVFDSRCELIKLKQPAGNNA